MGANTQSTSVLETANELAAQGYAITPVAYGTKKPILTDWTNLRISPDELSNHFGVTPMNIGVLLGEPSGGLVDIDLDCKEALTLASYFLPATGAIFGRESSPRSHWLYFSAIETKKFVAPETNADAEAEHATLVEIRSDNHQTVFPNSVHPTGERIRWDERGDPASVNPEMLLGAVEELAAASLITRHWRTGVRHESSKALAGALLRAGRSEEKTRHFLDALCKAAGDEEAASRVCNVVSTARKLDEGKPTTGLPTLANYFPAPVLERVSTWLHLETEAQSKPKGSHRQVDKKSMATTLVDLAAEAELFHTPDDEPYAIVRHSTHREIWHLDAKPFRAWLAQRFYKSESQAPSSQAITDALGTLAGNALYEGSTAEVFTRVAEHNGSLYLDLCDEHWRVVEITPDGWGITSQAPVSFTRRQGMQALPEPRKGGDANLLRQFINISSEDWPLIYGWLLAAYRPDVPFPILLLSGEQGSAKSTTSKMLRELIDPNKSAIRSMPREVRDLMIAAKNSWIVAFDNISYLPDWLSDALCRLSTGGGFATRELFANDEEVIIDVQRPIILNGIEDFARRSDLLDRIVSVSLPVIGSNKRMEERSLWPAFVNARPAILGGMLDAVSISLRNFDSVQLLDKPRMADFARWVTAAEGTKCLPSGSFKKAYKRNLETADDIALESSLIASAIMTLMEERESHWEGTATDLLEELEELVSESTFKSQDFPKRATGLGGILKRLAPNLRRRGIEVFKVRASDKKGTRLIRLERTEDRSLGLSEPADRQSVASDN